MVSTSEKFLLDANTLMAASRFFYAYDLVPSFWEIWNANLQAERIRLPYLN
ncbi:MAG: DUF4411 family protein [Roseburia sp.]|nr:DUF4411 family protein [Roseburia sp.]